MRTAMNGLFLKTPSLRVLVALALVAFAAVGVIGCGGDDKKDSPSDAVESALDKAADINSGKSEIKASILTGGLPASFDIVGGGPFDTEAEGGVAYDLDLSVLVAGTEQAFGVAAVDGKSYLTVDGKTAELEGGGGALDGGTVNDFIDSLSGYVIDASFDAERTVGGEKLQVYNFNFDAKKLLADASKESEAIANFSVPGLGTAKELSDGIENGTGSVAVAPDGFPRTITINVPIERGTSVAGVRLNLTVNDINQPVTVKAPKKVVPRSELGGIADLLGG